MTKTEIPAELLAELEAQRELLATAEGVSITSERMLNQRQDEYDAARAARDEQLRRYDAAVYAESIASSKLAEMCRAAGVIRTADGFRLAELATGPASAEIDPDGPPLAEVCNCGHTVNLHNGEECSGCLPSHPCAGWEPTPEAQARAIELGRVLGLRPAELGHLTGQAGL